MKKYVIGLMSGTSLDGLDICYVEFDDKQPEYFRILHAETYDYNPAFKKRLHNIYDQSALEMVKLDRDLGIFFGNKVLDFIQNHQINKTDLIASHGQTVFHLPQEGYTTQIGHGAYINAITKIKTVSDFRYQDVALGGEGAPLVPIGDLYLFPGYKYCLNLGGFANISIKENGSVKAFDICPANIVLNHYAGKKGKDFDKNGNWAAAGNINTPLLEKLNNLPEYQSASPKSFGWELVEKKIIPLIDSYSLTVEDVLATYTEHIAVQISRKTGKGKVLVTGGGAFNRHLMKRIAALSPGEIILPDPLLINFKEALIFALLGFLKDQEKINILSSVTGSMINHSSGVIYDAFSSKN